VSSLTALAPESGERLDIVVSRAAGISRSHAARLVDAGAVKVNGKARARSWRVEQGDRIGIELPAEPAGPQPEDIPVHVVHEDEWIVVVAKPAGMVVHPAPGHPSGTLVNALLTRAGRLPGERDRPGIVHRLDAGTSGLMIVAKDERALTELRRMMAAREVTRTYLALVEGRPHAAATIDAPVGRSQRHRKKMAVVAEGREAVTIYRRVEAFRGAALLEVKPRTGRTHQIRVHLATTGHPVVGDRVYGRDRRLAVELGLNRPFLHAAELAFGHPITGAPMNFTEPLPDDLESALDRLRTAPRARR
jgi:23S rRNA pseudouridine1911/1915/1917 synthase